MSRHPASAHAWPDDRYDACIRIVTRPGEPPRVHGPAVFAIAAESQAAPAGRPSGPFARWEWDGRRLTVARDRYGFFPLYYAHDRHGIALSPSLSALIDHAAPRELDDAALAVFLRLGFFIGDDTPWRAIRAVPPSSTFTWCDGQLDLVRCRPAEKPLAISRTAAVDGFIDLFRKAIARSGAGDRPLVAPLSGGRDSRHILLELLHQGCRPRYSLTARAFPPLAHDDSGPARRLAAALGLPHVTIAQAPARRLSAERRKNDITGFLTLEHAWFLAVADYLAGRGETIVDGLAGDVLSAHRNVKPAHLACFEAGRLDALAALLLGAHAEHVVGRLLSREAARRFSRDAAIARLSAELRTHTDAVNPMRAFRFWNRTRRVTALAPFRVLHRGAAVLTPYLDAALYDFLVALPPAMLLSHTFHTEAIARAYPAYADVPYAPADYRPVHAPAFYRQWAWACARDALRARPFTLLDERAVLSRLARCLLWQPAAASIDWYAPRLIYLLQLEQRVSHSHDGGGPCRLVRQEPETGG